MPLKQVLGWPFLRVCLVVGPLTILLLLELNIETTDFTLFVPRTQTDTHFTDGTTSHTGFLVNTNGCRIPDLDPMDPSVRSSIFDSDPINCEEKYGPALVESNLTSLYINESVLAHYNVSDLSQLICCYTPFWRVEMKRNRLEEYPSRVDVQIKFGENCEVFNKVTTINEEFVKVQCVSNNNTIYIDYHAFTPIKGKVKMPSDNPIKNKINDGDAVSVLIFGVDAVSRLNFQRQMPQTLKFLKKNLSAVEMLGYNKVEDNTFPNLMPVLTGFSETEIKESCWPSTRAVFDDCNFIWNNFSATGYITAFGEDATWMGIFSYLKRGFRKQPTDYYMKVFNEESESSIGFDKRLNAKLCVGPRKTLETLLSYAYKFVITMKDVLSFGFFWGASLTHDFLNLPKQGDMEHKEFLESLHSRGIFNRTVLIFMSDHGIRWGQIRGTYQGFLEERLPFLFFVYPDWFRIKYTTAISNLKKNAHKLTTPFDLHEVLLDLNNLTRLEKEVIRTRTEEVERAKNLPRGISLFLQVPGNRTCSDAGIVDHWCTCHQSSKISTNDTLVRRAANYLVKYVNSLLKDYSQCAKLQLNKILNAREERATSHSDFTSSDVGIKDYSLTIETVPGKALFEATVRHNGNTGSHLVVGTISRINLYGDQSKCISHYRLRLYCYCIHR